MDFLEGLGLEGLQDVGSVESSEQQALELLRRQQSSLNSARQECARKDEFIHSMQARISELEDMQTRMVSVQALHDTQRQVTTGQSELKSALQRLAHMEAEHADMSSQLAASTRKAADTGVLIDHLREDSRHEKDRLVESTQRVQLVEGLCEQLQADLHAEQQRLQHEVQSNTALSTKRQELEASYEEVQQQQQARLVELEEKCAAYVPVVV